VQLAFGSAIAILLAVSAIAYRDMAASGEGDRWVRHTHEVLENLQDLLVDMESVQSSVRGFALTGQESYVEAYRASAEKLEQGQTTVRSLTADNSEQQHLLDALASLAALRIQRAEKIIDLRRVRGLEAAAEAVQSGVGQSRMDDFRRVLQTLKDTELRLLASREADAKRSLDHTKNLLVLAAVLGLLITAAAAWGLMHDRARRGLAEAKYRGLLVAAPGAIVVVNQGREIVLLSVQAEKHFRYERGELMGQKITKIIPDGFGKDDPRFAPDAVARQIGIGIELTGRRKDGSEFPIDVMLGSLQSDEGILVTAAIRDTSVRRETQSRIRRLNRVYAVLSGINSVIVRARDRDALFGEACRIAVEHGRFKMAWIGVVDRSTMKIVPVASAGANPEFLTLIRDRFTLLEDQPLGNTMSARAIREGSAIVSNELRGDSRIMFAKERIERGIRSMAILPLLVSGSAVGILALYADETDFFDEEEMKLLTDLAGNIAFATDHIDNRKRLDYLAYYDELTGLANRSLFLERVAQYMRSAVGGGRKLALFLIDLERFKNINDSLGRAAGDALLRQVAEWLTHYVTDANLLARVGADQFAFVLPDAKQDGDVARLVEKSMQAFLDHPFRLNDAVFRVNTKVGVALFPDDGADADTLLRNAEAALKKAKVSGDRYLFYTQKMTETVAGKLNMENQLRQALVNDEFVLHYQPKVNLASGKVVSAEALIRWNDPRTGLVQPGSFISILEETGLIHEVGRWALHQAVEDYLRWRAAGMAAVRIAVNVASRQLRSRGFIDEVRHAVGVDAHASAGLELEITESMIMDDVKQTIGSLHAIRGMGVTIAIDDFGTGFSSLSHLSKLPVDTLKIDRSFVVDMTVGPQGLALVSTIINLAHSLKLNVVAEGVETEEQSRLLRLLNCDEMQGFLFSRPVPVEIFEARFLNPRVASLVRA
jgi:diguanylate cyclase (GGDEF)-like protein/PAS domain S-box-containing protein